MNLINQQNQKKDEESLFNEIGKELEQRLEQEKLEIITATKEKKPKPPLGAPKNCEEYFFLVRFSFSSDWSIFEIFNF